MSVYHTRQAASTTSGPTAPVTHDAVRKFLLVPFEELKDIVGHINLSIDASSTSKKFLEQYPMYQKQNVLTIKKELGEGFANYLPASPPQEPLPILHQYVATMQSLKHFGRDVQFMNWKSFEAQIAILRDPLSSTPSTRTRSKAKQHKFFSEIDTPSVIFPWWTIDPGPATAEIFETVMAQEALRGCVFRCFPSQTEIIHSTTKLEDIRALDAIAANSPRNYAYRPKTCFNHECHGKDMGRCPLAGLQATVKKRTSSSGGEHVKTIKGRSKPSKSSSNLIGPHWWFHQEYVPFFDEFGEFRVFIAAKPTATRGLRGREGTVMHTVITEWLSREEGTLEPRAAGPKDWASPHVKPLTSQNLDTFALHIYEQLRARADWKEHYESLEVGVRLDIGIAIEPATQTKHFFVNEITRFYFADYFSQYTLGAPQQQLCYAFAEAIHNYFPTPPPPGEEYC
ncbi:hypothetical protein MMC28_001182 [Mycoblastus sanguinarius]|nr:hypothetical protein [Mycoblastus sanguinarius]